MDRIRDSRCFRALPAHRANHHHHIAGRYVRHIDGLHHQRFGRILQKGFEYWTEDIARSYADKQTVIVDGEKMKAELHDVETLHHI